MQTSTAVTTGSAFLMFGATHLAAQSDMRLFYSLPWSQLEWVCMFCSGNINICYWDTLPDLTRGVTLYSTCNVLPSCNLEQPEMNSDVHLGFRCRKLNSDLLFKKFMYHLMDLKEAGNISTFRCSWIQGLRWDLSHHSALTLSLLFLECWLHSHSCLT